MMKMSRGTKACILLIIVGAILIIVNQIFYVPKFIAFAQASWAWSKNETSTALPSPETFGLNATSGYISSFLGWFGSLLIFAGALWLVILLITKIQGRVDSKT